MKRSKDERATLEMLMLSVNYTLNEDNVWVPQRTAEFSYSDGRDIELRLLDELRSAGDVSVASDELQLLIRDWPSEYHYSPLRANLFVPFSFNKIGSVLEVGSGCGAITRVLGERRLSVLALEGSGRRAAITRERCRDLENVTVCCDTFQNFTVERKFDVITFIGVLEYSPTFGGDENPIVAVLGRASELLTENGVLILGIENQLGLKYFNGCSEDHSGQLFTGLNDDYGGRGYCTLGRSELKCCLQTAGFMDMDFFYPFPDYKLPRAMVSERAFSENGLGVGQIVGNYPSRDYTGRNTRLFREAALWPLLERNGLLQELSNSFLVIAFKGERQDLECEPDWLVQTYSCPRKKKFLSYNVFSRTEEGVVVRKRSTHGTAEKGACSGTDPEIAHILGTEPFLPGAAFTSGLGDVYRAADCLEAYCRYLEPWITYLLKKSVPGDAARGRETLLMDGAMLDCLPANLILDVNTAGFEVIDQEWACRSRLETGFVIFRGIYRDLSNHLQEIEETALLDGRSFYEVIAHALQGHGVTFDESVLKRYIRLEITIQRGLINYPVSAEDLAAYLEDVVLKKRCRKTPVSDLLENENDRRQSADKEIAALNRQLQAIRKTWSWRVGRFITGLFRFKIRKS